MKTNEKGFGVLEVFLMVVVVGLLGAVGWLVYDRQKSSSTDTKQVSTKQAAEGTKNEPKTETAKQPEFFQIKELGVKFELSESLKGLYYSLGNNGRTAYFSLDEFKGTHCAADKTAQVALSRYTEEDFRTDEQAAALKASAKKIGNYYYFSMGGQSACSEDAVIQQKATKLRDDILQLLPTALQSNQ